MRSRAGPAARRASRTAGSDSYFFRYTHSSGLLARWTSPIRPTVFWANGLTSSRRVDRNDAQPASGRTTEDHISRDTIDSSFRITTSFDPWSALARGAAPADRSGDLAVPGVLEDLVQPLALDVGLDLHPDRQVVGELEAEFLAGQVLPGEQVLDAGVVDEEVEHPTRIAEARCQRRQVEDLVEARVLPQVRAADRALPRLERAQCVGYAKSTARQRAEQLVAQLRDVEVAEDDQVRVLGEPVLEPGVDPIREHLQLTLAPFR